MVAEWFVFQSTRQGTLFRGDYAKVLFKQQVQVLSKEFESVGLPHPHKGTQSRSDLSPPLSPWAARSMSLDETGKNQEAYYSIITIRISWKCAGES